MTRKIDKRACRKFAIPELKFNLNEGILHVERCPYIIRTAVHNISGQRILVLYIYQSENILAGSIKPRWVVFQGRYDFATLSLRENASATWQCSTLDSLDRIGGLDSKCAFYRRQDEARVARFCKCERGAISVLGYLQRLISRHRELERKWKKQRAIIERMKYVPVLPRDLKGFIHREVMPQYIFYDYQRKGPEHAFCTACRHEVSIAAAKHNTSGICPHCKKKILFKSRGKRGRIFDRETVQVLQKAKNGEMLLRIVKAYRTFTDADTPVYFSVYENARHFISLCSDGHCSTSPYYLASAYKDDLTPWKCGYRPHFLSWRDSFEGDTAGHLYFRNLAELLRNTPWQYSQLERFARIAATMDAIPYLNAYVQWPVIEYLVKAKLFRLVSDIVYGPYHFMIGKTVNCEGKNLQDVLKLDRSWLPLLQEVDPGIAQLNVIQWFINAGKRPDASMMKWCANNAIQDVSVLAELLSHMTMLQQQTGHFPYQERIHRRGSMYGAQTSLFAPMIDRQPQKCACKLLMPLPEETRLYMGQHQIGSAPEYMMDRAGNLYMYLECLKAAVETEGVFACDDEGLPPVFSAVREGTRFLQVYTYEEAVERLEQAEDAG